jgi:hypothetical protein
MHPLPVIPQSTNRRGFVISVPRNRFKLTMHSGVSSFQVQSLDDVHGVSAHG